MTKTYNKIICLVLGVLSGVALARLVPADSSDRLPLLSTGLGVTLEQVANGDTELLSEDSRIANGYTVGWIPHAAFIKSTFTTNRGVCSGALIGPRILLTAAHCVKRPGPTLAKSIKVEFNTEKVNVSNRSLYSARQFVIPSQFTMDGGNRVTLYGDIALLEFENAIPKQVGMGEMASPTLYIYNARSATLVGWGVTENGTLSLDQAMGAQFTLLDAAECAKKHKAEYKADAAKDKICFQVSSATMPCQGDSRGPFLVYSQGSWGRDVAGAVMSYGNGDCKGPSYHVEMATSCPYWAGWAADMMALFKLEGEKRPTRLNTVEYGQCYSGTVLATTNSTTAGKCCNACRASSSCKAWTWKFAYISSENVNIGTCYLRKAPGKKTKYVSCWSGYYKN